MNTSYQPQNLYPQAQQSMSPDATPKKSFIEQLFEQFGTIENILMYLHQEIAKDPIGGRLTLQVFLNLIGREEESFAVSNELLKMAPSDSRVLFNHGWHWLKRGELKKGQSFLENGRALRTFGNPALATSAPLWTPERGRRHRVHLSLEGGLGDEIISFRFAKDLAEKYNCHVNVICTPQLGELFGEQDWVASILQKEVAGGVYHNSWMPGMSASLLLNYEYRDISGKAYLSASPVKASEWKNLIRGLSRPTSENKKVIKVGIRWAGNPQFEHQQFRKFPPETILGLANLKIPENVSVQFFSFQRDNDLLELPENIVDLGPWIKTWQDTAAAVEQMDLMISSCTSVAHLSGALGRPTWVLVPALPYFVWALEGDKSPWYDSVQLFRQGKFGSWDDVKLKLAVRFTEFVMEK